MTQEEFYGIQYEKIFPYIESLQQRIAELEEELKPKYASDSCYTCKYKHLGEYSEKCDSCLKGLVDGYQHEGI